MSESQRRRVQGEKIRYKRVHAIKWYFYTSSNIAKSNLWRQELKYGYRARLGGVNCGGNKSESLQGSGNVLSLCVGGDDTDGLTF